VFLFARIFLYRLWSTSFKNPQTGKFFTKNGKATKDVNNKRKQKKNKYKLK